MGLIDDFQGFMERAVYQPWADHNRNEEHKNAGVTHHDDNEGAARRQRENPQDDGSVWDRTDYLLMGGVLISVVVFGMVVALKI